jgi:hypothetical protein
VATVVLRHLNNKPPILEGCAVLPPMHQGNGNGSPHRHQGDISKAKGKPYHGGFGRVLSSYRVRPLKNDGA